nr:YaaA family protein [Paludibacteraceae bacterium]
MQIILASAKIMNDRLGSMPDVRLTTPIYNKEAESFAKDMVQYRAETLAEILGCSLQIAAQNRLRFMNFFDTATVKLPAILAYHGQAYKHLKAETMKADDLNYAQQQLWITSFLYGMLRPLDAILPYRMEGNIELPSGEGQNMFTFWKSRLTDVLIDAVKADDGILIHLATEEYQHLFDWQRVRKEVRIIQPLFYVRKGNNLKVQAVWAKTCRGAMTRFIIDHRITHPEELQAFSYEGFTFDPSLGEPDYPHFVKL